MFKTSKTACLIIDTELIVCSSIKLEAKSVVFMYNITEQNRAVQR